MKMKNGLKGWGGIGVELIPSGLATADCAVFFSIILLALPYCCSHYKNTYVMVAKVWLLETSDIKKIRRFEKKSMFKFVNCRYLVPI